MKSQNLEVQAIWETAQKIDASLKIELSDYCRLNSRRIVPAEYSKHHRFKAASDGVPVIYYGFPARLPQHDPSYRRDFIFELLRSALPNNQRVEATVSRSGIRQMMSIKNLLRRWYSDRDLVGITDLHLRGTKLMRALDIAELSRGNLLAGGNAAIRLQEMLTLVVSSQKHMSDSHSDAPDGSNHCFLGKKLWLLWDTAKGQRIGLEDVSRDYVSGKARFSMDKFFRVPGARWFVIQENETCFIPGEYTHKVITLEDYIGIGSFYLNPANSLRSIVRWYTQTPLWEIDDSACKFKYLTDSLTSRVTKRVKLLERKSRREQKESGVDALVDSYRTWIKRVGQEKRRLLMTSQVFSGFINSIDKLSKKLN